MRTGIVGGCGAVQVGVAAVLLAGCGGGGGGGGGGSSDSDTATGDIKDSVTSLIKKHDCSAATAGYRKTVTGETDVKACSHALSLRNPVKTLKIGAVSSSGATGTAAVTTDGTKVTLKMAKRGDAWLVAGDTSGGSDSSASDTSTSDEPGSKTTTTTPSPSTGNAKNVARTKYIVALATYQSGRRRFRSRVLGDLKARNLAAVKGDFGQFRDTVFEFDGQVRKIDFPASMREDVNHLLAADRAEIADLDGVRSAASFSELQRLLGARLQADDAALARAVRQVGRDL